ncbi:L-fucono-1,5-lactonase-like [Branchiostoma floridae x Branchiostoma japonicum]
MAEGSAPTVDTHVHLWDLEKWKYAWPTPDLKPLWRNFYPEDLQTAMGTTPVQNIILVQVLNHSTEETEWELDLCEKHPFLAGVVGWVDLTDPQLESTLDRLASSPYFLGVRYILDFEADDWLARSDVQNGLGLLERKGLTYDLLIRPRHFRYAKEVVSKFPKLKFVINHLAKPHIKDGVIEGWREGMEELSRFPNVYCKLSGMVTEADPDHWTVEDFRPYVQHVLQCFGAQRCMFGSDWPVCRMANADYPQVHQVLSQCLDGCTNEQKEAIFGRNAVEFYSIKTLMS